MLIQGDRGCYELKKLRGASERVPCAIEKRSR